MTYEDLLNKADALGCALRNNGFEKGDRLGIWSQNCSGWIISAIAAARAGLISVMINSLYESSELRHCINKIELKGLVLGDNISGKNYYEMLRQLIPELNNTKPGDLTSETLPSLKYLFSMGKNDLKGVYNVNSFTNEYNNKDTTKYRREIKPEDGAIIHFTSGSTGLPKGGLDSNFAVVNSAYFNGLRFGLHEEHHKICVQVPMFHALGSIVTVLGGLRHGATLIIPSPTYSTAANINAMFNEKCTTITGTPTMYVDLLSQIRTRGELPAKLKVAMTAGAPCSPKIIQQIQQHLADRVMGLYGLTESTGGVFQSFLEDSLEKVSDTVGCIQDHIEAKVVDENGRPVPFGETGELLLRGYCRMDSYWNDPEKTKESIDDDGWLHTGDIFKLSPDGYGTYIARSKDIIVRGGENIAPKEIEDLLNTHPDIIECQVLGIADERLGEELCAVVRIKSGAKISLEEVLSFCSKKIAKYKIPKVLKVIDDFPKSSTGKILKTKLKEMIDRNS
ncbi:medium-chain acyl-CoA ligase ACSF2, mitochondrial-like isoform X2 [Leptidea sinapis]|nr:medium-chain acyl-CoA ligase ACSF2, mitochondrial-like isoform X2 [Leptidea sinapis]